MKKLTYLILVLLFSTNSLFSQFSCSPPPPIAGYGCNQMEFRIVNVRYDPSVGGANGSLVFDIEFKQGDIYAPPCIFTTGNLVIGYQLAPGVTINATTAGGGLGIAPTPNPLKMALYWTTNSFHPGTFGVYMERTFDLATVYNNDVFKSFSKVGSIRLPLTSPRPASLSGTCFKLFYEYQPPPNYAPSIHFSNWGSGAAGSCGGVRHLFAPTCPEWVCIDTETHPKFDNLQYVYCKDEVAQPMDNFSSNGFTGTWYPSNVVNTSTPGEHYYYFQTTDLPGCSPFDEYFRFVVIGAKLIDPDDTIKTCPNIPFNLYSAIDLGDTKAADYAFFTYDGVNYNPVANPTNLTLSTPGEYTYYVQYIPCPLAYDPIPVKVEYLGPPAVFAFCNPAGNVTQVFIAAPMGPAYSYSLDGVNFTYDPDDAIFTNDFGVPSVLVYLKNNDTGCISSAIASCDCPNSSDLTITDQGTGSICMGAGIYEIQGAFNDAKAVSVTVSVDGTFHSVIFNTPFTFQYTPTAPGNVAVKFSLDVSPACSPVEEIVNITVENYAAFPNIPPSQVCEGVAFDLASDFSSPDYHFYEFDGTDYTELLSTTVTLTADSTFYVRFEPALGCASDYHPHLVEVNALPVLMVEADCDPGTEEILSIEVISPKGTMFEYTLDPANPTSWQAGTTIVPATPVFTTVKVYVRNTDTGCVGEADADCDPCPSDLNLNVTGSAEICLDGTNTITVNFSKATSVSAAIAGGTATGALSVNEVHATGDFVTYIPSTTGTVTITFTILATADCEEVTYDFNFVVNPIPTYTINLENGKDTAVCSNTNVNFALTIMATASASAAIQYSLDKNDFTAPALITSQSVSPGATVKVYLRANDGKCLSDVDSINLTVNALPTVSIDGDDEICVGATTQLSPTTGGIWSSSDDTKATVTDAGLVTGVAAGTATFTFTEDATGCSATTSAVTVNAKTVSTFSFADLLTYCSDETPVLLPGNSTNTPSITGSWTPAVIDMTPGTTTYTFHPDPSQCATDKTITVTVKARVAAADISVEDVDVCMNDPVILKAWSTKLSNLTYCWYTSQTATTPVHVGPNYPAGSFTTNTKFYVGAYSSNYCETEPGYRKEVTIRVIVCKLLACDETLLSRVVDEDFYLADKYTHTGTDWDVNIIWAGTLDSIKYFVNGVELTNPTLHGCEFNMCLSTVDVRAYFLDIEDECHFTVFVNRKCPSTIPDDEGNVYNVTKVAGLCWTENLKATKYAVNLGEEPIPFAKPYYSKLYWDTDYNFNNFGLLYDWYSAVGEPKRGTVQGICPEGWHIPTLAELKQVNIWRADELKSTSYSYWVEPGTNLSGFDSRGAGKYSSSRNRFEDLLGFVGYWACDANGNLAPYMKLTYYMHNCEATTELTTKDDGLSVRCVLDEINCK